jgi:PAS domain S-box-containing protein
VILNGRAEAAFGYRRDELLGQKVDNIIPTGFVERLYVDPADNATHAAEEQMGTGIELVGRRKDGSEFPIEIILSPLLNAGEVLVTAAIHDISARKTAEAELNSAMVELKRSNDELEQFAYIASHDLQEPLRMVASYTQLLARRYKGRLDADADEFIAYAVDGSNRMQQLIRDLLVYSRSGTDIGAAKEVSSEIALESAENSLRVAIDECGAVITHDPLPAVTMNATRLTQIFQNLIGNAIKYRGTAAPRVHVSQASTGPTEWIFTVRDNGLGIDPQYFDRIFVLFQRLHGRKEFEGTGIGLAICRKVLERMGGRIWVDSVPGEGSTFSFSVPKGASA